MIFRPFRTSRGVIEFADWRPIGQRRGTVVLVHGGGVTPQGWISTIDGQPGWAPRLANAGYRTLVPTWPGLSADGRWDPVARLNGVDVSDALAEFIDTADEPVTLIVHSMAAAFGYRLAFHYQALIRAMVAVAPAPPGDIQPEPVVLSENDQHVVVQGQPLVWELPHEGWWTPNEDFLVQKLVGASRRFPPEKVDALRQQLVPIPAALLLERQNVRGSQVRIGDGELNDMPVLVIVGTHDTDHPIERDRAVADWLAERGANVNFTVLDGQELGGNGHMLMQESNSHASLKVVTDWITGNSG